MNKLIMVLALGSVIGFASDARAKGKADKPLKGKISSIKPDDDKKSMDFVILKGKNKEEITVVADDGATVTVDGNSAKLGDLVVGETVTITPASGKPISITAKHHHHKKKDTAAASTPAPLTATK